MLSFVFPEQRATAMWSSTAEGDALAQWGSSSLLEPSSSLKAAFDQEAAVEDDFEVRYLRPRQVHGSTVLELGGGEGRLHEGDEPKDSSLGRELSRGIVVDADALISWTSSMAPVVLAADCLPIALYCAETNGVAAVHAGWRGLVGGVLAATCQRLRRGGAGVIVGALGPYIHCECYEFKGVEQDRVVAHFGSRVLSQDHLDLSLVVEQVCAEARVDLAFDCGICTGCDPSYPSARIERTPDRLALAVVMGR